MNVSQEEWKKELKAANDPIIIDVRTPQEWEEGVVANALLINIQHTEDFIEKISKMDKSKPYFIYCRSGNRSGQACQYMESIGFTETYNLMGGMLEWTGELEAYNHE